MPTLKSLSVRSRHLLLMPLIVLCGFGSMQAQSFTISTSVSSVTLVTQQQGALSVTVTPVGGFSGGVILNCASLPQYASCVWPQNNYAVISGGAVTLPMNINTSDIFKYNPVGAVAPVSKTHTALAILVWPAAFVLLAFTTKKRKLLGRILLFLIVLYPMVGLTGCGNTYPMSVAPGTYTIQVQGGVPPTAKATFQLIVTP
jgi:hypothetical protein